jgi:hypothetical protein
MGVMRRLEAPALLFRKEGSAASVLVLGHGAGRTVRKDATVHLAAGNVYQRRNSLPEYGKIVRVIQHNGQVGLYFEGYGENP